MAGNLEPEIQPADAPDPFTPELRNMYIDIPQGPTAASTSISREFQFSTDQRTPSFGSFAGRTPTMQGYTAGNFGSFGSALSGGNQPLAHRFGHSHAQSS